MLFTRGIRDETYRDLGRILAGSDPDERPLLRQCWALLVGMLRYDPHLQGDYPPGPPFRILNCGLLRVFYRLRPLEDRYVDVSGVVSNPAWVP